VRADPVLHVPEAQPRDHRPHPVLVAAAVDQVSDFRWINSKT
jgi:hypothetical protein